MRLRQLRGRNSLVFKCGDALGGGGQAGIAPRQLRLGFSEGQGRGVRG